MSLKLYSYFRSSASFRVRIALALKGLDYDYVGVHLARGEQRLADFTALSPEALVPVLEVGSLRLTQSLAIMEYLDEVWPTPALLPADALGRARVRGLAQLIACDIHPLNNLRVLQYLAKDLQVGDEAKRRWYHHWVRQGLQAFEHLLAEGPPSGPYCHGDSPTLADCCLVPQIFNARRFDVALDDLPRVMAAFNACMALPAFTSAQPHNCPDYEAP